MNRIIQAMKNYFIPHEGNKYQPHALNPRVVAFVVMVAIVAEAAFVFGLKYVVPSSRLFGLIEVNALIDGTNQSRTANGLPALTVSPLLQEAAQEKANDMATKGYFAHTSPQGLTPWYWFQNVGYGFSYAGENLAVNFSDSQDVTNAWMNSPEHRANILSGDFTQIGMATARGTFNGQPAVYVVEEFGTPAAAPVAFVNTADAASAPVVVPPTSAPAPASTTSSAPAKAPAPKPVATVPAVVAMNDANATGSAQMFIAVKGVSTEDVQHASAVSAQATATPAQPAPAAASNGAASPALRTTFLQRLVADPRALANDFYYFLMIVFALALVLNIFIKIRIQHPRLILGGLLVIVVAGLCVMMNQAIGFHTIVI